MYYKQGLVVKWQDLVLAGIDGGNSMQYIKKYLVYKVPLYLNNNVIS